MTYEEFAFVFVELSVRLRAAKSISPEECRTYYGALQHLDIEFVCAAALRLAQARSTKFFPTTAAWIAEVRLYERELIARQLDEKRKRARVGAYLCDDCADTGVALVDEANHRYGPCGCQELRRLERLGRRPWPALPPAREG